MKQAIAAILLAISSASAIADDLKRDDETYVGLFADRMFRPDEKHRPRLDGSSYAVEARFGYQSEPKHWGYELRAFYGKLAVQDRSVGNGTRAGLGADAIYRFGAPLIVRPYMLAGVGAAYSNRLPGRAWLAPYVDLGFGLTSGTLTELWQRPLRVRAELRYAYEDYRDEYTDTSKFDRSNYFDMHAFVGLEFALTRHVPQPSPPPPEVVPIEEQKQ